MQDNPTGTRRILIVCAGNTCRSPMAGAVARHLLGKDAHVESAGSSADEGASATKDADQAMKERGLDISSHRSRSVDVFDVRDFDLVIAMTPTIARHVCQLGADAARVATLDIPDPYCKGLEAYRTTAIAIERELKRLFDLNRE